jgi:hypothetical protein
MTYRSLTATASAIALAVISTIPFTAQSTSPPQPPRHVAFSTFVGGDGPEGMTSVAVDGAGRAHVVGGTCTSVLPTTADALKRTRTAGDPCEGYLAIFSPTGSLLYASWIGASGEDFLDGVAVDPAGNIYLVGRTTSPDLPTTAGAYDRTCGTDGACTHHAGSVQAYDAFVMKLAPLGRGIVFTTYLGGDDFELPDAGIAVDGSGRVHVAGQTGSYNFPFSPGAPGQALQTTISPSEHSEQDAFYARLSADGTQLLYATYLGGSLDEWA